MHLELGVEKEADVPFCVTVGFMQKKKFNQQTQNIDTFYQRSVTKAQFVMGAEKMKM